MARLAVLVTVLAVGATLCGCTATPAAAPAVPPTVSYSPLPALTPGTVCAMHCTTTVVVDRAVSTQQVVDILTTLAAQPNTAGVITAGTSAFALKYPWNYVPAPADRQAFASAFTAALAAPGVERLRIDGVRNVTVDFGSASPSEVLDLGKRVASDLPRLSAVLTAPTFQLLEDNRYPAKEAALFGRVSAKYPTGKSTVQNDDVFIRVSTADLASAKAYVTSQPETKQIGSVAVSDKKRVVLHS
ncbi:MAG: hypothetical protein JWN80_1452 [Microbacteriaceae bacterium]|nr:hypothetical protein [Microbacteriaceae bacterium]